tara:strand:+ start:2348 stop:3859 length:1512 start_codon:yes stop_codon:yes gene_type:complete
MKHKYQNVRAARNASDVIGMKLNLHQMRELSGRGIYVLPRMPHHIQGAAEAWKQVSRGTHRVEPLSPRHWQEFYSRYAAKKIHGDGFRFASDTQNWVNFEGRKPDHHCYCCGNWFENKIEDTDDNGDAVCDECIEKNKVCARTGRYIGDNDTRYTVYTDDGEETWCKQAVDDEAWECEHTGDYYSDDIDHHEVRTDYGTERWCTDSVDSYAFWCDFSEQYWSDDDHYLIEVVDTNQSACREYASDHGYAYQHSDGDWYSYEEEKNLKPYDYDVREDYGYGPYDKLALGVELECWAEDRDAAVDFATDYGFVCKSDGSISSTHGFEVVGPPMLLDKYKGSMWHEWCEEATDVKSWYGRDGQYGMHVSVNGHGLSVLTKSKAVYFVNMHPSFIEKVAGRSQGQYWQCQSDMTLHRARYDANSKYLAINWKGDRLEFRMFKGNRKWEGFVKNIEFVHAVMTFASQAGIKEMTVFRFKKYVARMASQFGQYKVLAKFLSQTPLNINA